MTGCDYEKKRDVDKTPEPADAANQRRNGEPIFVVQKHAATSLHYDFRLEIDGTLKSWAVPKGPSTDPRDKRLAVRTEDHPLAYADFEGIIPEGHYGAGTVLVWDYGTFDNITEKDGETVPAKTALEDGHLLVRLHGKKISGGYAMQRIRKGKNEQWLLIKMDDDDADARRNPVSTQPKSVKSGRNMGGIREDENTD